MDPRREPCSRFVTRLQEACADGRDPAAIDAVLASYRPSLESLAPWIAFDARATRAPACTGATRSSCSCSAGSAARRGGPEGGLQQQPTAQFLGTTTARPVQAWRQLRAEP
jgi:hypothetical protein